MEIDSLPKGMVLIQQKQGFRIVNNSGKFGEYKPGFHIVQPVVGFVKKEFWDSINIFQNLNIDNDEVKNKFNELNLKVTEENLLKYTDLKKWIDLKKETKNFYHTVVEFNVLVGINWEGEYYYKRTMCSLGIKEWEIVNY
jgi:hypothetical protein